jgi:hypothetical protein
MGGWRLEAEGRGRRRDLRSGAVHAVARLELMGHFADFWAATGAAAQAAPVGDPPLGRNMMLVLCCCVVWCGGILSKDPNSICDCERMHVACMMLAVVTY